MKLIPISDTHVHSKWESNRDQWMLFEFLKPYQRTHYLLHTADCTDDGHSDQYRQFQEMLKGWEGRVFMCPGNHDYGWEGIGYTDECARRFEKMLSEPFGNGYFYNKWPVTHALYDDNNCNLIIALNSNLKTVDPTDFACGEIGQEQLDKLSDILLERDEYQNIILMLHHHPWLHWDPFMRLKDANKLLHRIKGKVDIFLFGHRHQEGEWYHRWGIPLTLAAPSTPSAGWFNEIVVEGRAITVNRIQWRI